MGSDQAVPPGVDIERPSSARMYDYFLGGAHNFESDRRVAEQAVAVYPEVSLAARANRAFLRRAVQFLSDDGIRQFLDVGSGIPTVGHVHEIAQATNPDAHVVYVDIDPVAVAHSRQILEGNERTGVIQEDVRNPESILDHPETRRLIDFTEPVAVLVVALFHFVADADQHPDVLARLMGPMAPGSYLVISHGTADGRPDVAKLGDVYNRSGISGSPRSRAEVEELFSGFELVEPGVVWVPQWRNETPDDIQLDRPESSAVYAGVARKS